MTKACRCLQGEGGIKPSEHFDYIFSVFENFLDKKEKWKGNGGFINVTSEQLNFEHKIARNLGFFIAYILYGWPLRSPAWPISCTKREHIWAP